MKRQHEVEKRPLGNQHAIFTEPQGGEIQEHFNHRITVEEIASIDNLRMAVCQVRRNAGKGKGINKQVNKRKIQSVCDNCNVSAQPAPSGFEIASVLCFSQPRTKGGWHGTRRTRLLGGATERDRMF